MRRDCILPVTWWSRPATRHGLNARARLGPRIPRSRSSGRTGIGVDQTGLDHYGSAASNEPQGRRDAGRWPGRPTRTSVLTHLRNQSYRGPRSAGVCLRPSSASHRGERRPTTNRSDLQSASNPPILISCARGYGFVLCRHSSAGPGACEKTAQAQGTPTPRPPSYAHPGGMFRYIRRRN